MFMLHAQHEVGCGVTCLCAIYASSRYLRIQLICQTILLSEQPNLSVSIDRVTEGFVGRDFVCQFHV